jgi:hypothetical protein
LLKNKIEDYLRLTAAGDIDEESAVGREAITSKEDDASPEGGPSSKADAILDDIIALAVHTNTALNAESLQKMGVGNSKGFLEDCNRHQASVGEKNPYQHTLRADRLIMEQHKLAARKRQSARIWTGFSIACVVSMVHLPVAYLSGALYNLTLSALAGDCWSQLGGAASLDNKNLATADQRAQVFRDTYTALCNSLASGEDVSNVDQERVNNQIIKDYYISRGNQTIDDNAIGKMTADEKAQIVDVYCARKAVIVKDENGKEVGRNRSLMPGVGRGIADASDRLAKSANKVGDRVAEIFRSGSSDHSPAPPPKGGHDTTVYRSSSSDHSPAPPPKGGHDTTVYRSSSSDHSRAAFTEGGHEAAVYRSSSSNHSHEPSTEGAGTVRRDDVGNVPLKPPARPSN